MQMCQRCHADFSAASNHELACVFHAESWSGETAQRWLAPGVERGGARVHVFYSCCGAGARDAVGCCAGRHVGFDEDLPATYDTGAGQARKRRRQELAAVPAPPVSAPANAAPPASPEPGKTKA